MPTMRPPLLLLLLPLVLACDGGGSLGGGSPLGGDDDDDATSPEDEPLEGDWAGQVDGVIIYGGVGSYPCTGFGEATVDATDRASGTMDCRFDHTDETCTYTFEALLIGGGQRTTSIDGCFGEGDATHSMWFYEGQLLGRVQRLGETVSLEFSWALEQDRD